MLRKKWLKTFTTGQTMIEYILVFVGVVGILIVILGPTGFFSKKIEETIDTSVRGTECLALDICYDPVGCPSECGNGCCEADEDAGSCPADCS